MGQLTESEFADVVNDVAASRSDVVGVSIGGFGVNVTFRSNSWKPTSESYLHFDEQTWHYTYRDNPHYPGASASLGFGDAVQRGIREIIAS